MWQLPAGPDRQLQSPPRWLRRRGGHRAPLDLPIAGRRAAALAIDLVVLVAIGFAATRIVVAAAGDPTAALVAAPTAMVVAGAVIAAASPRPGTTLGKLACGLVVTDPGGRPIGRGRAVARSLLRWPAVVASLVAFWIAPLHDEWLRTDVRRGTLDDDDASPARG